MSGVPERLRECRERSGRTFREISSITGFSGGHLANVHNGKEAATLEMLNRLAPVYGTSLSWLRDGDERVNIWPEFQTTSLFRRVNDPAVSSSGRVSTVISYLNDHLPGHLQIGDLAKYMDVSSSLISQILSGERLPTRDFTELLSQICGVPVPWFELGPLAPLQGIGPLETMTAEEIRQLLLLGAKAKAAGLTIEKLSNIIEALAK